MDEFAEIRKRMEDLKLERDKPFGIPLQPDLQAELGKKIADSFIKPVPKQYDEYGYPLGFRITNFNDVGNNQPDMFGD